MRPFAGSWKFKKLNAACVVDERDVFFRLHLHFIGASEVRGAQKRRLFKFSNELYTVCMRFSLSVF
jgi:hypothetical protein